MEAIGIKDLDRQAYNARFSRTPDYENVKNTFREPEKFLDNIPETRATFNPAHQDLDKLDPVDSRAGCCQPGAKGTGCVIF